MKAKINKAKLGFLLAFILILSFGSQAFAATVTFDGSGGNDWNTAGNWDTGSIPTANDDAIIPDGFNVTLSGGAAALTVTINGTSSLDMNGQTLTVAQNGTGGITVNSTSATAFVGGAAALTIGSTTYRGDLVNNSTGTIDLTGTPTVISGVITNNAGGNITTTATTDLTLNGTTSVSLPSDIQDLQAFVINKTGASVTMNGDLTMATTLDVTSGTFIVGDNDLSVTGVTTVESGTLLNGNASSSTYTRIFGAALDLNGTATVNLTVATNTFTGAVTLSADANPGSTLNLTSSVSAINGAFASSAAASLNLNGADATFDAGVNFANTTANTNANTVLAFTTSATNTTLPTSITELLSLTLNRTAVGNTLTLTNDLTIYNGLTIAIGTVDLASFDLTVSGAFAVTTITGILTADGSTVTFNGTADFGGAAADFSSDAATNIVFNGSGAISNFPNGPGILVNQFTYNRTGETLTLDAAGTLANTGAATPAINITSGTVQFAAVDQLVDIAATTTTISSNGTLNFAGFSNTFLGTVTGTGTLNAANAGDDITFSGAYSFTGDLQTDTGTLLTFDTDASDISLNSSVEDVASITFNRNGQTLTVNSDITFAAAVTAVTFDDGTIDVNGNELIFALTYTSETVANGFLLDARDDGSSLVFTGIPTFAADAALLTDQSTDLTFGANTTIATYITECNNLLVSAGTTTQAAALTVYGNLDVVGTLDKATFDLTVFGNISNTGTMTLSGAGGTVTVHGLVEGSGTYTTGTDTDLSVAGTNAQSLNLPGGITTLGTLTLNRPNGMKIYANLTVGDADATDISIVSGNCDLNGFTVTLANATDVISETAGNRFINTGATSATTGFVTTAAGATDANIAASGIGVSSITSTNSSVVRRYPKTVPVPGVGLSTARYYRIVNGAAITALSLVYDQVELNSDASALNLYNSTSDAFSGSTEYTSATANLTFTRSTNSPSTGFNTVAVANSGGGFSIGATTSFYALAGVPGSGGVLKTFASASGDWSNAASWTPSGVPTDVDQVVIGPATVTISGNGQTFECASLVLNHAQATLQPNTNGSNGDIITLLVNGDITVNQPGAEIKGVNGTGRINLQIGDGTTAGVASTITTPQDYVTGAGILVNDFTVNGAAVDFSGSHDLRVAGDLNLVGNSSFDGANTTIVFYGGTNSTQTIDVASSAFLSFGDLRTENAANVTTNAFMEVTDQIIVKQNTDFRMTGGTVSFPTAPINAWTVENGGDLYLWNVEFTYNGGVDDYTPIGTAYIQGDFTKAGTSGFIPASGTIVFSNGSQRQLVNTGLDTDLQFYNLEVEAGSSIQTSSSLQIQNNIDVKTAAEFKANNGTITMLGGEIFNASTQTLEFFNLTINGNTVTSDSWTIKGDLTLAADLTALGGTITFKNTQQKTITTAANTLVFYNLGVATNSSVTNVAGETITIRNNATNQSGAGITISGTGELDFDPTSITVFDAAIGVAAGNPKTISVSDDGSLTLGLVTIAASPNNKVTTDSDLEISAAGASAFNNAGGGGYFEATDGTVEFTGAAPVIISVSPAVTVFNNVLVTGVTQLTQTDAQEIHITGGVTINDQASFTPAGDLALVIMDGSTQQILGGNSQIPDFLEFARLQINKGSGTTTANDEVLLATDLLIDNSANTQLTLSNGVLNLGSYTFTNSANTVSRVNGVINGGTGTYVVNTGHETPLLEDAFFTVNNVATLYNLRTDAAHTTANDLTVNGTLDLNLADITVASGTAAAPIKLILKGDLTRTNGDINGGNNLSTVVFDGTGAVTGGLSNSYFNGGTTTANLNLSRAESLGGDLDITAATDLSVNTGVNSLDLNGNTLTFANTSTITMVSGGILAGLNSEVIFPASITQIPASMFRNNEVYDVTFAADMTLRGDLTLNGTLTGVFNILTGENVFTVGQNASLPIFTNTAHVNGNLRRTVTSNPVIYNVGGGSAATYRPVTLQFGTAGSEQEITLSSTNIDPTIGRGGNPTNAANLVWGFDAVGTDVNDSLKVTFQWPLAVEETGNDGVAVSAGTFPAKWTGSSWNDYRNSISSVTLADPRVLTMAAFPVSTPADLEGDWAVFNPDANTDAAKDAAISVNSNKVVITSVTPSPIGINEAFDVTVQLQDQFGQPIQAASTFEVQVSKHQGAGTFAASTNVITAGETSVTFNGLTITGTPGTNHQLIADTTGGSSNWQPGLSESFKVLDGQPATQANAIVFNSVQATSIDLSWTLNGGPDGAIVVAKADGLLSDTELPIDGNVYIANSIYGAGSSIGSATVVYNGTGTNVEVTGLAPNTTYYFYVFQYDNSTGTEGTENYKTTAAAQNPNSTTTLGGTDDDVAYGENNSFATSKAIGTNTPVRGLITDAADEDWFNFTVTSASSNLRTQLSDLPANFNIEVYDIDGNLIRRGIRMGTGTESPVVNNLPAGTYVVRIYGFNGEFDNTRTYTLQVTTRGDEIYSVTP